MEVQQRWAGRIVPGVQVPVEVARQRMADGVPALDREAIAVAPDAFRGLVAEIAGLFWKGSGAEEKVGRLLADGVLTSDCIQAFVERLIEDQEGCLSELGARTGLPVEALVSLFQLVLKKSKHCAPHSKRMKHARCAARCRRWQGCRMRMSPGFCSAPCAGRSGPFRGSGARFAAMAIRRNCATSMWRETGTTGWTYARRAGAISRRAAIRRPGLRLQTSLPADWTSWLRRRVTALRRGDET